MEQCWGLHVMLSTWCPLHLITTAINPLSAFLFYRTNSTIACRRHAKRPAWSHKAGLPLNPMPPELHCFTFSPSPILSTPDFTKLLLDTLFKFPSFVSLPSIFTQLNLLSVLHSPPQWMRSLLESYDSVN